MTRKFWENLASLFGVHVLNYIVPLVTLPFLARTLGNVHWGELAFAEAYAGYVSLCIEYGFGLSATRDMAQVREDPLARSRLLAGVLGAQLLLVLGTLILTLVLYYAVPVFAVYKPLLPVAFILAALRAINPFWYFQGLEQMRLVASLTILTNVGAAAAMLTLVHSPKDSWIPLGLRSIAALVCALAGFGIAYRDTPFSSPTRAEAWLSLRRGWSLFLFKSAVSLYTTANVLLLGVLAAPAVVAWFAGAERIAKAAVGGITPLTQAFYPRINFLLTQDRDAASRTARMSVLITVGSALAIGLVLLIGAPFLVRLLLGPGFSQTVPVLRLLSALPPLIAVSNVLGIQWMVPLRLDRQFNWIIAGAGLLNLLLALILVPISGQMGMAVSVVIAELVVTAAMILVLRTRRLDPWSAESQKVEVAA
jgi:PST family polysaccharide transporter